MICNYKYFAKKKIKIMSYYLGPWWYILILIPNTFLVHLTQLCVYLGVLLHFHTYLRIVGARLYNLKVWVEIEERCTFKDFVPNREEYKNTRI